MMCFHIRYLQYFQHHLTFSDTTNAQKSTGGVGGSEVDVMNRKRKQRKIDFKVVQDYTDRSMRYKSTPLLYLAISIVDFCCIYRKLSVQIQPLV
jgi:hypothetical protein